MLEVLTEHGLEGMADATETLMKASEDGASVVGLGIRDFLRQPSQIAR